MINHNRNSFSEHTVDQDAVVTSNFPDVARLLVVDDEASLRITTAAILEKDGYVVDTASSGEEAIELLEKLEYDLVLTDLHMEGGDGLTVLSEIRRRAPLTISIVLTGFASVESAIAALQEGAYDYLVKPFAMAELEARIRALHRRGRLQHGDLLRVADLTLDPIELQVERAGQKLTLTRAGFVLLDTLMRQSPHVVRHADLVHALWGEGGGDIATLHTHLSVLRSAVDRPFSVPLLHTVHGFGYRIAAGD